MDSYTIQMPVYSGATIMDGIELKGQHLFVSPPGCCAQTTLPFRAKVVGKIKNLTDREILTGITVHLMGSEDAIVKSYTDAMILDSGQTGEFDVQLIEYDKSIRKYSLEIEQIDEEGL